MAQEQSQGAPRQDRPRDDRQRQQGPRPKRSPEDRNVVFIGNKPPMNYVLAVVTQFNSNQNEVVIRARGKAISQAVDVAEIVRNKFFQKATVKGVAISTESVTGEDGRRRAVSAIEIRLINVEGIPAAPSGKPALPEAKAPAGVPVEPVTPAKSGAV